MVSILKRFFYEIHKEVPVLKGSYKEIQNKLKDTQNHRKQLKGQTKALIKITKDTQDMQKADKRHLRHSKG